MVNRIKRNYFIWALLSPVLVGVGYWFAATAVITVGCRPPFVDTDFFGKSVMFFLLGALSLAALVLIVFAGLHALRALRARVQRRQRDRFERRVGAALIVLLSVAVFAIVAWLGRDFVFAPCS